MKQRHVHGEHEKVPEEECLQSTGKRLVQEKMIDINKGDEVNYEHRSRLAAKGINMDKRFDLFAATPLL